MSELFSLIIPTKNEEKNLPRLLQSLKKSKNKNLEVIVVDNYSTDNTRKIAKKFRAKVFTAGPERSAQRNFGARQAKGNFLIFLDADMELANGLISECQDLLKKSHQALILSEKVSAKGFWAKCRGLEKNCYLGDELIEAARGYDKKLFEKSGGYDENLIAAEDWDLHQRAKAAGARIGRTKNFVIHHEKETNPLAAFQKKYYYGLNLSRYFTKHPNLARQQLAFFRPAFFRHWRLLLAHPLLTAGMYTLKFFEFLGGGLGLLKSKISK